MSSQAEGFLPGPVSSRALPISQAFERLSLPAELFLCIAMGAISTRSDS